MKKKAIAAVLMMSMIAGSSLTVCAAPETMVDGTVFDAEYYAQTYPDVVAALGADTNALYQHYVTYGKAEGRIPYETVMTQKVENSEYINLLTTELPTFPDEVRILNNARVPVVLEPLDGHYLQYTCVARRAEFGVNGDRKDYSSDPIYLAVRDYIITHVDDMMANGQMRGEIDIPVRFIDYNYEEGHYFINLVDNLEIDLNKSEIGEKVYFFMGINSADGKGYVDYGHEELIFCTFGEYPSGKELFEEQKNEEVPINPETGLPAKVGESWTDENGNRYSMF